MTDASRFLTLVIGSKTYSSWSLRPWLVLRQAGIPFEEILIPQNTPQTDALVERHSPSGYVPVLRDGRTTVWDSLAICEYVADRHPEAGLWPSDLEARAVARSVSAEMHAGFADLRRCLPLDCGAFFPGFEVPEEARGDVARVTTLWADCRRRFGRGGDLLFGRFTIADAMFAPVVLRFLTYDVRPAGEAAAYMKAVMALPGVEDWLAAARLERA